MAVQNTCIYATPLSRYNVYIPRNSSGREAAYPFSLPEIETWGKLVFKPVLSLVAGSGFLRCTQNN
jgi:hypothetical protein